jgi:hypothetical protein
MVRGRAAPAKPISRQDNIVTRLASILLMFAVLNVDAMVRSSLPHDGLFPSAFDSFLLSPQNLLTRVSTVARHPEYSI